MSILSTHMNSLLDGQAWLPAHKQEQNTRCTLSSNLAQITETN